MRFLLLNQFYPPDAAPTGRLLADVVAPIEVQGLSASVVCAHYGYAAAGSLRRFARARLADYAGYYLCAAARTLFACNPDTVLTLTTPPLLPLVGTLSKLLRHSRHIIWEMDVYPDVAVALGTFKPRGVLDRLVGALADFSRRRADAIIALGPCMRDRLIARGIPPEKIHVAENWADGSQIRPVPRVFDGCLRILYSGNLGLAHDIDTIAQAMRCLSQDSRFRFTFAGGGPRRKALEQFCGENSLANVAFEPYKDPGLLSEHLGSCDIGLVTQNPATLGAVVPSKAYAIMAAGRPVLYIGPPEATPAINIRRFQCGWQIAPGDVEGLVSLLQLLAANPDLVRDAGHRAREAFEQHFDLPLGVARIMRILCPDSVPGTESLDASAPAASSCVVAPEAQPEI